MFLWFNCTLESLPYGKIVLCQNLSPEPWSTIFQQLTLLIYPFDLIRTLFVKVFEFNKDQTNAEFILETVFYLCQDIG